MVDIGKRYGKETVAIITNMDYPLGKTIGNSLEVLEAISTLDGKGDNNFTKLCLVLSSYMVSMGKNISIEEAANEVNYRFNNKDALKKFKDFIIMQGGDITKIPINNNVVKIYSENSGYITNIDAFLLANLCNSLGAGRIEKDDKINPSVGIRLYKSINDKVTTGELLMDVYTDKEINKDEYLEAIKVSINKIYDTNIIYDVIK